MANPKHRHSKGRTHRRRAHDALDGATLVGCQNCGEKMRPHRACRACGYYKARKWHRPVISVD